MGKPLVVLADSDEKYVLVLECRLLEALDDIADIEVISDEECFQEFVSFPHDIEAMVVSEQFSGPRLAGLNIEHLYVLAEEEDSAQADAFDPPSSRLFKYSAPELVCSKVLNECVNLRKHETVQKTSVVLCHTPVGGAGTTTVALALASAFNAMYKRVLYVDAEHVQSFASFLSSGSIAGTDMARDMSRSGGDVFTNMLGHLANDGFDYVPPLRSGLAGCGVEFSFYERFIASARASGRYDYIVVDTDERLDESKTRLLGLADSILVPVTQDVHALHKVMKLFDNIDGSDKDRYHFVCNKYRQDEDNAFSSEMGGAIVVLDGYVEYDPSMPDMDAHALGQVAALKKLAYALA